MCNHGAVIIPSISSRGICMNLSSSALTTNNVFPFHRGTSTEPKLLFRDKAILTHQNGILLRSIGVIPCLHTEEFLGNYCSFTIEGDSCSSWAVARQEDFLVLWHTRSGEDLGSFQCIEDVIYKIESLTFPARSEQESEIDLSLICLEPNIVYFAFAKSDNVYSCHTAALGDETTLLSAT